MAAQPVPALTTKQMVEVDRLMIVVYGISLIQMMENAGCNLAALTRNRLDGHIIGRQIAVVCGAGNNGGGGLAAARHLSNWGAAISVFLAHPPERLKEIPHHQWNALAQLPVDRSVFDSNNPPDLSRFDMLLDAVIGYGLQGSPRDPVAQLIQLMNGSGKPIIALDAPSGLDTTEGVPGDPCIKAAATMTLALPKTGLMTTATRPVIGDLFLADISVPPSLYQNLGLEVPLLFSRNTIVRVPHVG